jgi:hypothetical protein
MGTITATGTPSVGSWYEVIATAQIVAFTGAFSIHVDAASAYPGPSTVNFGVDFYKASTGVVAASYPGVLDGVLAPQHWSESGTVGETGWSSLDFDAIRLRTHSTFQPPQIPLTLTLTAAGLTVPYCAYGTENNPDATAWSFVSSTVIDVVATGVLGLTGQVELIPYVDTALAAIEGTTLQQPDCSALPPPTSSLDLSNLLAFTPTALQQWFQSAYWHYF